MKKIPIITKCLKQLILEAQLTHSLLQLLFTSSNSNMQSKVGCAERDEVKAEFKKHGYIFKPTGYINGVWQDSEDICW